MKLLVLISLCALAVAAPNYKEESVNVVQHAGEIPPPELTPEGRNIFVNALVRQLIAYIRYIIKNGSSIFGIPPLDPLELDHLHINLPSSLLNIDLELEDIHASGFGGFVTHKSTLNVRDLTFDLDISFPQINIYSGKYALAGDLLGAVPVYGNGEATFEILDYRFQTKLKLKQSEDGKSVTIDHVVNSSFQLPHFKSGLTGVIGGGPIDDIANAIIEDVLIDYVNRFQGAISLVVGHVIVRGINPILEQHDTWRFIAPFV